MRGLLITQRYIHYESTKTTATDSNPQNSIVGQGHLQLLTYTSTSLCLLIYSQQSRPCFTCVCVCVYTYIFPVSVFYLLIASVPGFTRVPKKLCVLYTFELYSIIDICTYPIKLNFSGLAFKLCHSSGIFFFNYGKRYVKTRTHLCDILVHILIYQGTTQSIQQDMCDGAKPILVRFK